MIERIIEKRLYTELTNNSIITIIGARQVGKTTLLNKLKKHLFNKNKVVNLFTLEDKFLLSDLNDHPKNSSCFIHCQVQGNI